MSLMKPTESWAMTAEGAARRQGYAATGELALRNAMEALLRQRHPEARICHEMVMGAREVRADMVAISPATIAAVEVKGPSDNVTRLLHQAGMYQLCVPEVWLVVSKDKRDDADLIRYLMPSIGIIAARDVPYWIENGEWTPDLEVVAEPVPRDPHPRMMLEMMWAEELSNVVTRLRIMLCKSRLPRRSAMIDVLLESCGGQELLSECCAELRARHALWRADAPTFRQKAAREESLK